MPYKPVIEVLFPTFKLVNVAAVPVTVVNLPVLAVVPPIGPGEVSAEAILAITMFPEAMFEPFNEVKLIPDSAGRVAGNLASGIIPELRSAALRVVMSAKLDVALLICAQV